MPILGGYFVLIFSTLPEQYWGPTCVAKTELVRVKQSINFGSKRGLPKKYYFQSLYVMKVHYQHLNMDTTLRRLISDSSI